MENTLLNQTYIRPLIAKECNHLVAFVEQEAEQNFVLSSSFAWHHAASIFLCTNEAGEWLGVVVSWQSPTLYNTAVIEGVAVKKSIRGHGIGGRLLAHAMHYWRNECVLNMHCILEQASERARQWFVHEGFEIKEREGLKFYFKRLLPEKICMHQRKMLPRMNTVNGQISEDTLFEYYQKGDIVWGTYSGGDVARGVLVGVMSPNKDMKIRYFQLGIDGHFSEGTSKSSTEFLNDGRIVLYENWIWTGNRQGEGNSIIEEIIE